MFIKYIKSDFIKLRTKVAINIHRSITNNKNEQDIELPKKEEIQLDLNSPFIGRTVKVMFSGAEQAYYGLKSILNEHKYKEILKRREYFERPCDKKRRKRKERNQLQFKEVARSKISLAIKLKNMYYIIIIFRGF